jgi:hypothetical protein
MIHFIKRAEEVVIAIDGVPYVCRAEAPNYEAVLEALADRDEETLVDLLSIKGKADSMLTDLAVEGIEEVDGRYYYKGNPLEMGLSEYLYAALKSGDYMPVVKFVQRLFENPSHDTRQRLFTFMDTNQMPIDSEGRFLAFKAVTSDFKDKHTRKINNAVGVTVPLMSWSEVDTNPSNHCSRGYHACSKDYIVGDGAFFYSGDDRVIAVAIAPEHVGSIPDDYNGAKLRCRKYEVLSDITDSVIAEQENVRIHHNGTLDPYDEDSRYSREFDYY